MSTEQRNGALLIILRILEKIIDYVIDVLDDGEINGNK